MRLRHFLILVLVAQALLVLLLAWGLYRIWQAPPWLALAAALALVVLLRLAVNLNNFRLSAPMPALGLIDRLRLVGEEFMASLAASSWTMPRGRAHTRIYPDDRRAPVLLLHGYYCNSGYWRTLVGRLDRARISHATLDLEPLMASIDDYALTIDAALAQLLRATGAPQAVVVAHSMGGLAARAYVRAYGCARLAQVVTLGTPHAGTRLATRAPGHNAAQMRCGSAWLDALAASETAASRAVITSLYSHHDNIIAPQNSSCLAGACNIGIAGVGHVALGSNRRMLDLVMDCIDRARSRREGVGR